MQSTVKAKSVYFSHKLLVQLLFWITAVLMQEKNIRKQQTRESLVEINDKPQNITWVTTAMQTDVNRSSMLSFVI